MPNASEIMITPDGRTSRRLGAILGYVREKLSATKQIWVNPSTGDDAKDGLTQVNAIRTLQLAIDMAVKNYDWNVQVVQILALPGVHAPIIIPRGVGAGRIQLNGYGGTLGDGSCKIWSTSAANAVVVDGAVVELTGNLQLSAVNAALPAGLSVINNGLVTLSAGVQFYSCSGPHMVVSTGGKIKSSASYWIDGNAQSHIHGTGGGAIDTQGATATIRNSPAFSAYFVGLDDSFYNCVNTTWVNGGTVTGPKMTLHYGGRIRRDTNNINNIPGDANVYTINKGGGFDYIEGGLKSLSSSTTLAVTDAGSTILCDAGGGSFQLDLPAASSAAGVEYVIKKVDASVNTVTIDAAASETIDGATTLVLLTQWSWKRIKSNGVAWFVVG